MIKIDKLNITSLFEVLNERRIISISGESGTGKTTLALQLISSGLTQEENSEDKALWIQASELFPKKRLHSLYKNSNGKSTVLLKKIFLHPRSSPFLTYEAQSSFFKSLRSTIFPYGTKYLTIDNISHHLRLAVSCCSNFKQRTALLDEFFSSQLFPIIMRCLRENIVLILIHEVSFNPTAGKNLPFFNKLYSRINSVNVNLSKTFGSKNKTIVISSRDEVLTDNVKYEIKNKGISII